MTTMDVDDTESTATDDGVRLCALPGCDTPLPPSADETKRYCCPAHRKSARRHRRGTSAPAHTRVANETDHGAPPEPLHDHQRTHGWDGESDDQPTLPGIPVVPPPRPEVDPTATWITQPMAAVGDLSTNGAAAKESPSWWPAFAPRRGLRTLWSRTTDPYASAWTKRRARREAERLAEAASAAASAAEAAAIEADAAAMLARRPLVGEEPPPGRTRRRSAGARVRSVGIAPNLVSSTAWAGQTGEALVAAVHSLKNNRLRSFLTTVGIIAGVASVILLVAMGDGMTLQYQNQADKLANQINISPARSTVPSGGSPRNLTDADVDALHNKSRAPHVTDVSPVIASNIAVTAGQAKNRANLVGVQQNYLRLMDRHIVAGRWFTESQITGSDRGAVLGPQAVALLYGPKADPHKLIGKPIRLSHSTFTIIGVIDSNGQADNLVAVPFGAARSYLTGNDGGRVDSIVVKSTSLATLPRAMTEIATVLDEQHFIHSVADRDFNINNYTESIRKSQNFVHYLSIFIVAIAAISLFVGGVGVANIMLVSVTERTREIGIRKAVGAKTSAILRQFLSESVMLTALGGLVGVALGIGSTKLAEVVLPHYGAGVPNSDVPLPILTAQPVLVAFGLSLLIGLAAGGYPAHRAARMPPIEALRFE